MSTISHVSELGTYRTVLEKGAFLKADAMVRLMCELNAGIRSGEEQGWVSEADVRNHIQNRRNHK